MLGTLWKQRRLFADILVVVVVLLIAHLAMSPYLDGGELQRLIEGLGPFGPLLFLWISAAFVVLFVPSLLSIGLGPLAFGKIAAACYSLLGITVGTCLAFLLGRYLFKDLAVRLKQGRLKKIDECASTNGLLFVIALRLVFFSLPPLNYAVGTTAVTFKDYFLGSLIGLLPRTFIFSFVFENLQEPRALQALLLHPSSLLLLLLPLTRLAGIGLLAMLARHRGADVVITP